MTARDDMSAEGWRVKARKVMGDEQYLAFVKMLTTVIEVAVAAERAACLNAIRPVPGGITHIPPGHNINSYGGGYADGVNECVASIEARALIST